MKAGADVQNEETAVGMPAAKTGTPIQTHSGLYAPDPKGKQMWVTNE